MASRSSRERILRELRVAARKGDRTALEVALDGMRTLALSPRYWEKYLLLLRNPMARLVDLLVIKQGERIAYLKGRRKSGDGTDGPPPSLPSKSRPRRPGRRPKRRSPARGQAAPPRRRAVPAAEQPTLFEL